MSLGGRALLSALTLTIAACGGGSSSSSSSEPPARGPIEYGYYLSQGTQSSEVYYATTFAFLGSAVTNETELLQQAADYANVGIHRFVVNLVGMTPAQAAITLPKIAAFGTIAAIYPVDEPNVNGCPATLDAFKALGYPLATIYGPARLGFPCIEAFAIVGLDDYDKGSGVLSDIDALSKAYPGLQLMLVPGGASPWKADPGPFVEYAKSHPKVWGIVPFLWYSPQGIVGIRDNGMSSTYQSAGTQVIQFNQRL